jgi:uncharacterized protein (TIGR03067 family)
MTRLALAAGLLALAAPARGDEPADLKGKYVIVGLEVQGVKLTEDALAKFGKDEERRVEIDGDRLVTSFNGKKEEARFKLDPAARPARIDITVTRGDKAETNHGIYKVDGDTLTICAADRGEAKDRPAEFKAEGKAIILVLRKLPQK